MIRRFFSQRNGGHARCMFRILHESPRKFGENPDKHTKNNQYMFHVFALNHPPLVCFIKHNLLRALRTALAAALPKTYQHKISPLATPVLIDFHDARLGSTNKINVLQPPSLAAPSRISATAAMVLRPISFANIFQWLPTHPIRELILSCGNVNPDPRRTDTLSTPMLGF